MFLLLSLVAGLIKVRERRNGVPSWARALWAEQGLGKQIWRAIESQREPERARGSQREPERARESQTESQREPERARESRTASQREPEWARESQREPERARESQREPERARESRTASQKEPEWARDLLQKYNYWIHKLFIFYISQAGISCSCVFGRLITKREAGLTSLACLSIVLLQNSQIWLCFVAKR